MWQARRKEATAELEELRKEVQQLRQDKCEWEGQMLYYKLLLKVRTVASCG